MSENECQCWKHSCEARNIVAPDGVIMCEGRYQLDRINWNLINGQELITPIEECRYRQNGAQKAFEELQMVIDSPTATQEQTHVAFENARVFFENSYSTPKIAEKQKIHDDVAISKKPELTIREEMDLYQSIVLERGGAFCRKCEHCSCEEVIKKGSDGQPVFDSQHKYKFIKDDEGVIHNMEKVDGCIADCPLNKKNKKNISKTEPKKSKKRHRR